FLLEARFKLHDLVRRIIKIARKTCGKACQFLKLLADGPALLAARNCGMRLRTQHCGNQAAQGGKLLPEAENLCQRKEKPDGRQQIEQGGSEMPGRLRHVPVPAWREPPRPAGKFHSIFTLRGAVLRKR